MELVCFPTSFVNCANYNNFELFPSFALPCLMRQYGIKDPTPRHFPGEVDNNNNMKNDDIDNEKKNPFDMVLSALYIRREVARTMLLLRVLADNDLTLTPALSCRSRACLRWFPSCEVTMPSVFEYAWDVSCKALSVSFTSHIILQQKREREKDEYGGLSSPPSPNQIVGATSSTALVWIESTQKRDRGVWDVPNSSVYMSVRFVKAQRRRYVKTPEAHYPPAAHPHDLLRYIGSMATVQKEHLTSICLSFAYRNAYPKREGDTIKSQDATLAKDVELLLTRDCPNLKHVFVQGFRWSTAHVPSLFAWACRDHIEEVCLVGCRLAQKQYLCCASSCSCEVIPSLRRLSIRACGRMHLALSDQTKCVPSMPKLTSLSMTRCTFTMFPRSGGWLVAPNLRELILLHSNKNYIGGLQKEHVESLYQCFPKLKRVWVGMWVRIDAINGGNFFQTSDLDD
eukprot:PhM_4_TR11661/c3_g1_i1/m.64105